MDRIYLLYQLISQSTLMMQFGNVLTKLIISIFSSVSHVLLPP